MLTKVLVSTALILSIWGTAGAGETAAAPQAAPAVPESGTGASETPAAGMHTEKTVEGAFGIPLGKPFEPSMVAEILKQEERAYVAYGDVKVTGTRFEVTPKAPSEDFQKYAVDITPGGIVYEIRAWYADEDKASQCEKTQRLADRIEARYGKARGKGDRGTWYSFRPPSDLTRSASLYAHRCKVGMYSVAYRDYAARKASAPEPQETGESAEASTAAEPGDSGAAKNATESEETREPKEPANQ